MFTNLYTVIVEIEFDFAFSNDGPIIFSADFHRERQICIQIPPYQYLPDEENMKRIYYKRHGMVSRGVVVPHEKGKVPPKQKNMIFSKT